MAEKQEQEKKELEELARQIPQLRWIVRVFTKLDELVDFFATFQKRQLELLEEIKKRLPAPPPEIIVRPEIVIPRRTIGVVEIDRKSIKALAQEIVKHLVKLPNRMDRIEINTSITTWKSLKKEGKIKPAIALGFWVESIGGGFDYRIIREGKGPTQPRTAVADDKWDQEFDDLLVKGAGAGTAVIYIWWRA